ncbi:MAG: hypothetical protein KDC54_17635 [Lewinella sp.]|nr:hypothetical protein [Lewinella sp.]
MSSPTSSPYLSIVVSGRNDNYGGDFERRLQRFVDRLTYLIEKYQLPTELLLVNYNPLADRPGLEQMIQWPAGRRHLRIRMITVPPDVHRQFIDPSIRKTLPFFEFVAKNIGLRRATGAFILATNADILFPEEMVRCWAERSLTQGCLYRANRLDFHFRAAAADTLVAPDLEDRIAPSITRFYLQGGTFRLPWPQSIRFRLSMLHHYNQVRQWVYPRLCRTFVGRGLASQLHVRPDNLFLLQYPFNASGDFILLDRASCQRTGAYPEDTLVAMHTDSLHLVRAMALGIPVTVLPYPIFHQEHARRFDPTKPDPAMDQMMARLIDEFQQMKATNTVPPQADDWGLAGQVLPEIVL